MNVGQKGLNYTTGAYLLLMTYSTIRLILLTVKNGSRKNMEALLYHR